MKKRDVIVELLRQLDSVILPEMLLDGVDALYDEMVRRDAFAGTRADALIEFSRAAHAEMAALNGALLSPVNVRDCDVYTTTFPCHMCTRLIIGAGIRNVVYIEPYPKSASVELYGKTEIQVNPLLTSEAYYARIHDANVHDKRTYYIPFEGVAPRRFTHLFSNAKGKSKDGSVLGFVPVTAKPRRIPSFIAVHRYTEEFVAKRIAVSAETLRQATTPNVQPTNIPAQE